MTREEIMEAAAKVAVAAEMERRREDQRLSKDAQAILHKLRQILGVLGDISDALDQGAHEGAHHGT